MVRFYKNEKGFSVFEIDSKSYIEKMGHFGGNDLCDKCLSPTDTVYYVPIIDKHLCSKCYSEWFKNAEKTVHTDYIEVRNENKYKKLFNI